MLRTLVDFKDKKSLKENVKRGSGAESLETAAAAVKAKLYNPLNLHEHRFHDVAGMEFRYMTRGMINHIKQHTHMSIWVCLTLHLFVRRKHTNHTKQLDTTYFRRTRIISRVLAFSLKNNLESFHCVHLFVEWVERC